MWIIVWFWIGEYTFSLSCPALSFHMLLNLWLTIFCCFITSNSFLYLSSSSVGERCLLCRTCGEIAFFLFCIVWWSFWLINLAFTASLSSLSLNRSIWGSFSTIQLPRMSFWNTFILAFEKFFISENSSFLGVTFLLFEKLYEHCKSWIPTVIIFYLRINFDSSSSVSLISFACFRFILIERMFILF